jgi:hypothetical protein
MSSAPIRTVRRLRSLCASTALVAAILVLASPPASPPKPQAATLRTEAFEPQLADSQVSAADQEAIMNLHNQYRAAVGVAPLTWDDQLASDAQKWADDLVQRGGGLAHDNPADPNDPDTGNAKGEGENLAGGESAATAPTQWFSEKSKFDAATNKSGFGASNPDWFNWGHYTQMVWSTTTKIGCGTAPGPKWQITSCRYSPPGNFDGQLPYPGAGQVSPNTTIPDNTGTQGPGAAVNNPSPAGNGNPGDNNAPIGNNPAGTGTDTGAGNGGGTGGDGGGAGGDGGGNGGDGGGNGGGDGGGNGGGDGGGTGGN